MSIQQQPGASHIPTIGSTDIEYSTLGQILRMQAQHRGERKFLNIGQQSVSFAEMDHITDELARGMRALGAKRSDRVAILLKNSFEMVSIWFAAAKLGAIEVPNNPNLKGDLLIHNLNNCGAEILFSDRAALLEIAKIQDKLIFLKTLVLIDALPEEARAAGIYIDTVFAYKECFRPGPTFELPSLHYSDPMAILYTSGTTGSAKGVVMSHHHCFAWAAAMALNMGYTANDSYFSALPLFHTDAQLFGVFLPLIFGTETTVAESFSASKFWDQVRKSGATATNLLGAMAVILMRAPISDLDKINAIKTCQCIPMLANKEVFEERFNLKLVTGYGQTETSFVTLDQVGISRSNSCGRAHPDWEVAVVDEFDRPLPAGSVGEILSRPKKSWCMFSGYYNQDAKTIQTLRNLWYHSGDAGYLDEDGWLYFKHRLNESIRRRGENISAYEVESIAECHPDVVESAAFGIPSEFTEEEVMIVARRRKNSPLNEQELLAYFKESAPRHMVPRYIEIIDTPLPRTPTEKISRAELKKLGVGPLTFDRERG